MVEIKVHIRHFILWEFKNNKDTTETAKETCSGQGVITNYQVWNCFSKFRSGDSSLKNESRQGHSLNPSQDALKE